MHLCELCGAFSYRSYRLPEGYYEVCMRCLRDWLDRRIADEIFED